MKIATVVVCAAIGVGPLVYGRSYILAWNFGVDILIWIVEKLIVALQFVGL